MSDVPGVGQEVPRGRPEQVAAAGPLAAGYRWLLEQMYRVHGPVVWRIVYAWTGGDRDTAEDAVAEAFARAGRRQREGRSR